MKVRFDKLFLQTQIGVYVNCIQSYFKIWYLKYDISKN